MLNTEAMETTLCRRSTWSPNTALLAILRCLGLATDFSSAASDERENFARTDYHVLSYADSLAKTNCESVERMGAYTEENIDGVRGSHG